MRNIPLIRPYIPNAAKQAVLDVLDSGYLTEGPVTKKLEAAVAVFTKVKYAIAVTSCTTGLEIALRSLEIGHGDEVIVPDYTYPATADVVAIVGATPVIVEKAGISVQNLSHMEHGRRPIGKDVAKRLAKILNTDWRLLLS